MTKQTLLDLLASIQWEGEGGGYKMEDACPACGGGRRAGHENGCWLEDLLLGRETIE